MRLWYSDGMENNTLIVTEYSTDFRKVTKIVHEAIPTPGDKQILIKNHYLGINASDINWAAGRYPPRPKLPFVAGFESIGTVVRQGKDVVHFKVGDCVATAKFGAFADYLVIDENMAYPVPAPEPKYLSVAVSGLTASVALEQSGHIKAGDKLLVTAAAGGTGLYAVQLGKLAGCHVIATCGTDEKVEVLKKLGCDRVINYKKEDMNQVLKKEYPKGIDVVYESVGGDTFEACVNNIAVGGRIIIIGMLSGYQSGSAFKAGNGGTPIPSRLLSKSASLIGFFVNHYSKHFRRHYLNLLKLLQEKKIESFIEPKKIHGIGAGRRRGGIFIPRKKHRKGRCRN